MRGRVALARVELAQSPGAALLAQRRDPPAAAAPMQHGEEESGLRLLDLRCRCWLYAPGAIDQSDAAGHIAHMDYVSRRAAARVPPREGARVKGLDRLPALGVHSIGTHEIAVSLVLRGDRLRVGTIPGSQDLCDNGCQGTPGRLARQSRCIAAAGQQN